MAALYDRSSHAYLIDRYPVAVTPSLEILGAKASMARRPQILVGGLTPTSSSSVQTSQRGSSYEPLAYAEAEIQGIKALFPQSTALIGQKIGRAHV